MISQHQYQVVCDELGEARDRIEELKGEVAKLECRVNERDSFVTELEQENIYLEDLAQMIIDAESADPYARLAMYYSWLYRAKQLKEQS